LRPLLSAVGVAALLAAAVPAAAHSLLLESSPPVGGTLRGAGPVTLRFNNRIEKRLSGVRLVDTRGVGTALAVTDGGRRDELTALAPALPPGPYRAEWRVLSTDGHVVSGSFPLQVEP
jgi:methionine-rich copper-binding protein CopC